jgi:aldehyde:ferredoxin oxidoreductase
MVLNRKVAFVDFDEGTVASSPVDIELRKKFLGGRGVNMAFLFRYYISDLNPFPQRIPLIFGTGLLAGILAFGSRVGIPS